MGIAVLDIGTSSMRGILYDDQGNKLFTEQTGYSPVYLPGDRVEQAPGDWKEAMEKVMKACAAYAGGHGVPVQAVSLTSQRSSVIAVDEDGEPIGNAIMWQDKRVLPLLEELKPCRERIFALTGSLINPVFSGSKMMWIKRCMPDLYGKASRLVVIPDYIVHEMTGNWVTDATYGSRSLLMNLHTRCWDKELLKLFDVDKEKLCAIIEPGSVAGTVSRDCAARTGLMEGTPVISAGGDQQCAALGMGILNRGDLEVSAGTGAYIIAASGEVPPGLQPDVICNASAVPGEYILESSILSCASVFNWFLRIGYGMTEENRKEAYAAANEEIRQSLAKEDAPMLLPFFQGRGTPDWNSRAKGCLNNLTLGTTRGDIARSIMEGLGYEIEANIDAIKRYTGSAGQIALCGGLANSDVFCRILAGICGRGIDTYLDNEATAIGAWMSASVTLGLYPDYKTAFCMGRQKHPMRSTEMDRSMAEHYSTGKADYRKLYRQMYPEMP